MPRVEITPEITDKVKEIPPCTIGVESNAGFFQTSIKIFYIVRLVWLAVKTKQIGIKDVLALINAITNLKVNHVYIYWGSGVHETVDAGPLGVRKHSLLEKINSGAGLRMFHNNNITVQNMQLAKMYSYGTVGRNYGYPDFISFAISFNKSVAKDIKSGYP